MSEKINNKCNSELAEVVVINFMEEFNMMHDPEMEVTCDSDNCTESVYLQMNWTTGGYDLRDDDVKRILENDHGWQCIDQDKHLCSSCREDE